MSASYVVTSCNWCLHSDGGKQEEGAVDGALTWVVELTSLTDDICQQKETKQHKNGA